MLHAILRHGLFRGGFMIMLAISPFLAYEFLYPEFARLVRNGYLPSQEWATFLTVLGLGVIVAVLGTLGLKIFVSGENRQFSKFLVVSGAFICIVSGAIAYRLFF
jgi:hypothetical protein